MLILLKRVLTIVLMLNGLLLLGQKTDTLFNFSCWDTIQNSSINFMSTYFLYNGEIEVKMYTDMNANSMYLVEPFAPNYDNWFDEQDLGNSQFNEQSRHLNGDSCLSYVQTRDYLTYLNAVAKGKHSTIYYDMNRFYVPKDGQVNYFDLKDTAGVFVSRSYIDSIGYTTIVISKNRLDSIGRNINLFDCKSSLLYYEDLTIHPNRVGRIDRSFTAKKIFYSNGKIAFEVKVFGDSIIRKDLYYSNGYIHYRSEVKEFSELNEDLFSTSSEPVYEKIRKVAFWSYDEMGNMISVQRF